MGLQGHCTPKTERQSRELGNLRAGRAPRGAASQGRMYHPERLTVAAWMTYTGQEAKAGEAREVPAEALQAQQEEEQWQVGPAAGPLVF